jgi:hypothetical protein
MEGDGLSVDGTTWLQLDGAAQAVGAEGVPAALGGDRLVEGCPADGADEGLIYLVDVVEVLVVDGRDRRRRPRWTRWLAAV